MQTLLAGVLNIPVTNIKHSMQYFCINILRSEKRLFGGPGSKQRERKRERTLEQDGRGSPRWEHVGTLMMDYTVRDFHVCFTPPHASGRGAPRRPFENLTCPPRWHRGIKGEQRAKSASTVIHLSYCKGEEWEHEWGVVDCWWKISIRVSLFLPNKRYIYSEDSKLKLLLPKGV